MTEPERPRGKERASACIDLVRMGQLDDWSERRGQGAILVLRKVDRPERPGRLELEPFTGPDRSLFAHVAASLSASVVRQGVPTFDRRPS